MYSFGGSKSGFVQDDACSHKAKNVVNCLKQRSETTNKIKNEAKIKKKMTTTKFYLSSIE
jgi:hypothetical protein